MGKKFGELAKIRGVIHYRLSPYEQNIFAGMFSKGLPNLVRRIRSQILYVAPPFILGYLIYDWGNKENKRYNRKNPADFANDE
ncbi:cytochrome b-c1 complex subunit 8-like [Argiope bruennichi]|uniref:Cytochrome b-c1 complex subunit 8 n=1 Tax=Argiope bruennichi TaxID=94029 RepID=A0A8T0F393_ARGBR|nr:cytochrome b-c1 complex subunit 8-like [Argiope bruennichi]KAF8783378.1 Cytochrome b-c1 complex subunit 8 like protein [Argiope bruennichi]